MSDPCTLSLIDFFFLIRLNLPLQLKRVVCDNILNIMHKKKRQGISFRFFLFSFSLTMSVCFRRNSHEDGLNHLPTLDAAMMELLSFEEAELLSMISEVEAERTVLQEKLKKCNRDLESQMEAIQEEDQKLETIVNQFS